jgi:NAD(P)-dependent dehydrogenase (short-subunit alcohol dehydrogenase family)
MNRVKDKVAIITGAALGIGRATALLFAKEGAKVAITDVRDGEGKDVAKQITREGGVAEYWHLDVAREAEVRSVFADIERRFERIDVLVNNAGIAVRTNPPTKLRRRSGTKCSPLMSKVFFCARSMRSRTCEKQAEAASSTCRPFMD